jgi:hypothetical protein
MSEASWTDLCVEGGGMTMLRQGDVLLVHTDDLPSAMDDVPPERRGSRLEYVLAHGEATGHAHAMVADDRIALRRHPERGMFLIVQGWSVELRHEEHRPLPVPRGNYRIVRQRTYDLGRDRNAWSHVRD